MKHFEPNEAKITLLTIEQAKRLPKDILACSKWWWLRSPGYSQIYAAYVNYDGDVFGCGSGVSYGDIAVRPAFEIENLNSEFGEKVYVGKLLCTVIDKDLVLADECVCCHRFDSKSNDWETSELKTFIESEEFARQYITISYHEAISSLSIVDIVKAVDYINELSTYIPADNEVLDYLDDIVKPFIRVQNKLKTKAECPKCKNHLFKSDLPQYDYVCANCDENFFECEL